VVRGWLGGCRSGVEDQDVFHARAECFDGMDGSTVERAHDRYECGRTTRESAFTQETCIITVLRFLSCRYASELDIILVPLFHHKN
jgi:hypothetical protein